MLAHRTPGLLRGALVAAALAVALPGCQVKDSGGDAANGKKLFVAKCGSCHVMQRAGTTGVIGPNLDDAFAQDRADGFHSDTLRGVVQHQIVYPNRNGVMPGKLYTGQNALDVATYVGQAAAKPGQDTGAVANAVPTLNKKPAVAKNGQLEIDADPTGQLAFLASKAQASAGSVTLRMQNKSSTPHNISIKGSGVSPMVGKTVQGGGFSTVTVSLKPGTYTFYCDVPGHFQGMHGPVVVK